MEGGELPERDDVFAMISSLPKNNDKVVFKLALVRMLPDDGG